MNETVSTLKNWKQFPKKLIENVETTKSSIDMLKVILKLQQGKIANEKGLIGKIKFYLLGYIRSKDMGSIDDYLEKTKSERVA